MTERPIKLSVVMPCFREASAASETVAELKPVLNASFPGAWEVIVVDDGGGDFPRGWRPDPAVSLIELPENRGKGHAIRAGMEQARGSARVYTDIDLPYDPWLIPVTAEFVLKDGFHLVLGDRRLPESDYQVDIPIIRRGVSAVASFVIGTLVTGGFFDTQCGLKGIRGDVANLLFPLIKTDRFVFDVELVYLALFFNCNIKRIPVTPGRVRRGSTVRPLQDSFRASVDIMKIKQRAMAGEYRCEEMERIVNAPMEERLERFRMGGHEISPGFK
jgi:dolichyl-phosphate beta-glucosyltransferase